MLIFILIFIFLFIFVIPIIPIIILAIMYARSNNEVKRLRKRIEELEYKETFIKTKEQSNSRTKEFSKKEEEAKYQTNKEIKEREIVEKVDVETRSEERKLTQEQIKHEVEIKDQDSRNTMILVTGAILIVLAAIVFLTSTWHAIPNIIKTTVLVLLIGVFGGASKLAKEKFNLTKTANTFYYLAMIYIPLVSISISFFGLFGDYLSMFGEGRYIYLTVSSILISILYCMEAKRKQQKVLRIIGIVTQEITCIFITLMLNLSISYMLLIMFIHNMVLQNIEDNEIKYYRHILLYILTVFSISRVVLGNLKIIDVINSILLTANYFITVKEEKEHLKCAYIGIYLIFLSCINLQFLHLSFAMKELVMLIIVILMYFGSYNMKLELLNTIITFCASGIIYLLMLTINNTIFPSYIVLYLMTVLFGITYMTRKDGKEIMLHFIPIGIIVSTLLTFDSIITVMNVMIAEGLLMMALRFIPKCKEEKVETLINTLEIYGIFLLPIAFLFELLINYSNTINNILLISVIMIEYIGKFLYAKNDYYKVLFKIKIYILSNVVLLSICSLAKLELAYTYIIPITTIGILILENIVEGLKDKTNRIYLLLSFIVSFIVISVENSLISAITMILFSCVFVVYRINNNMDKHFDLIPMIFIVPVAFMHQSLIIGKINYTILLAIGLIIATSTASIIDIKKNKKLNMYTIMSFVYLIYFIFVFVTNKYIDIILLMVWSVIHFEVSKNKFIQVFSYAMGLVLYNKIIADINLTQITAINLLGYIIFVLSISRTILKKVSDEGCKIFETISSILIYLIAIFLYSGQSDGMAFGILLIFIVIGSYIMKFGPIFLTSISAIILNAFILTRAFWFSIPWWIYMLAIGTTLITFAVRNEAKDNKKENVIAKKIKEYMDM